MMLSNYKIYADLIVYYQESYFGWSSPVTLKHDLMVTEYASSPASTFQRTDIKVADLDNNGKKDIVTFSPGLTDYSTSEIDTYASLAIYWQEENSNFTEQLFTSEYFGDVRSGNVIDIVDIDSDGTEDIVFTGDNGESDQSAWYRNKGSRQFSDIHFLTSHADYWNLDHDLSFFADLNNDQQIDMLLYGRGYYGEDEDEGLHFINPDIPPPYATLTATVTSHINEAFEITIETNEDVTGLNAASVTLTGASLSNWQEIVPGLTYRFTATPSAPAATVVATIAAESFGDASNIGNREDFTISVKANNPDADGDGIADDLEDGDYNGDGINDNLKKDPGIDSAIGGGAMSPWMLLLLLPLTLMNHAARAESFFKQFDFKNVYAGLIVGKSYLTPDDDNSGWKQQNEWDARLGVNVGYQFHDDAFAEIQYLNAGEVTFTNRNPNIPGEPHLRYSVYSLLGGYYLNQHSQYRVYVRTGISQLKTDSSSLNNDHKSNLVVPFGAGFELALEPNWNLRLGADYYSEDLQNLYLNLKYQH